MAQESDTLIPNPSSFFANSLAIFEIFEANSKASLGYTYLVDGPEPENTNLLLLIYMLIVLQAYDKKYKRYGLFLQHGAKYRR